MCVCTVCVCSVCVHACQCDVSVCMYVCTGLELVLCFGV